jgi:hypothetical protein
MERPEGCAGLAFAGGGMARPSLGVFGALFCRLPGIGGRSNGAGGDMAGWVGSRGFAAWEESV